MSLLKNKISDDVQLVIDDISIKLGVPPGKIEDWLEFIQVNWFVNNKSYMLRSNYMRVVEVYSEECGTIDNVSVSDL
tara:strand:- start:870 stop:1100 length:231 start_codon:yes stop_codon:yes gene_type:complete